MRIPAPEALAMPRAWPVRAKPVTSVAEGGLQAGLVDLVHLEGVHEDAGAERLGQEQAVAGAGCGVGQEVVLVRLADHGQAELELVVAYRVAAQEDRSRLGERAGRTLEDAGQGL